MHVRCLILQQWSLKDCSPRAEVCVHIEAGVVQECGACHDVFHVGRGVVVLMRNWDTPGSTDLRFGLSRGPSNMHANTLLYLCTDRLGVSRKWIVGRQGRKASLECSLEASVFQLLCHHQCTSTLFPFRNRWLSGVCEMRLPKRA